MYGESSIPEGEYRRMMKYIDSLLCLSDEELMEKIKKSLFEEI